MTVQINQNVIEFPRNAEETVNLIIGRPTVACARGIDTAARYVAPRVIAGTKASLRGFGRGLGWLAGQTLKGAQMLENSRSSSSDYVILPTVG